MDLIGIRNNPITMMGKPVSSGYRNAVLFVVHDSESGLYLWTQRYTHEPIDIVKLGVDFARQWTFAIDDNAVTAFAINASGILWVLQMHEPPADRSATQAAALKALALQYDTICCKKTTKTLEIASALGPTFRVDHPMKNIDAEIEAVTRTADGWRIDLRNHAVQPRPAGGVFQPNDLGSIFLTPALDLVAPKR